MKLLLTLALLALSACKPGDTTGNKTPATGNVWLLTIEASGGDVCWQVEIAADGEAEIQHGGSNLADGQALSFQVGGNLLEESFAEICGGGTGDLKASFSEIKPDGTTKRKDVVVTGWGSRTYFFDNGGWL